MCWWLGRLPDWEEFALRAYKQCPGGARDVSTWPAAVEVLRSLPIGMGGLARAAQGGLQGKSNITFELKEDQTVIIQD